MHCSRVFRSSAPSDHLPPHEAGAPAPGQGGRGSTRSTEWGVGPGAACHIDSAARQGHCPPGVPGRHASGAGPLSGEGRTMRDPELVAHAQRAATRLESAWEQWRALHGLAVAPGQPVVSYVGYSLKEPWGEPRVVIGIDADEAEYLADFLDHDECAQRPQIPQQQARRPEPPAEGTGERARSALLGFSVGRHAPDQIRDIATDLASWNPGELPGPVTDQLAAWPPSSPADQPPASA